MVLHLRSLRYRMVVFGADDFLITLRELTGSDRGAHSSTGTCVTSLAQESAARKDFQPSLAR